MCTLSQVVSVVLTLCLVTTVLSQGECPKFPANGACFDDPCRLGMEECGPSRICCPDYSSGCDFHCIPKGSTLPPPPPFSDCPDFTGDPNLRCIRNPCNDVERCPSGQTCCSATNGCDFKCIGPK